MTDTNPNVFGAIYSPHVLIEAVETCLRKWFPTFITEIERQYDINPGTLKRPTNYTSRNKQTAIAGEQLPKVVIVCPGLISTPTKTGNGVYGGVWRLGVGVATAQKDEEAADKYSKLYGAVVRDIIIKKQGELGTQEVIWLDESYDDLPITDQVWQYRAAAIWFSAYVQTVSIRKPGPPEPDAAPYELNTVDTVIIDVEKEPLDG